MKTLNNSMNEMTESTNVKTQPENTNAKKSSSHFWQSVLVGGVPGILIGSSAAVAVEAFAESKNDDIISELANDAQEKPVIKVADTVTDDMSFRDAFAAARTEVGPGGAFVWHGKVFCTYRADDAEWQEMTDEERAEHSQDILSQVHPAPYSPTEEEPEIVPDQTEEIIADEPETDSPEMDEVADVEPGTVSDETDEPNAEEPETAPEEESEISEEVDVHIVGVAQAGDGDGSKIDYGYGQVDGHSALFIDNDGDGEVDTVLIDVNNNQTVDEEDVFIDVHGSGTTIEALAAEAETDTIETTTPEEPVSNDIPEYTNDIDAGDTL